MKNHKKTVRTLLIAAVLLIAVFITGCTALSETQANTNFSDEEFAKLSALQFDGYEEMTVSEFQNKVWELTDTNEYRSLLERFSRDTTLYVQRDSDALASFCFIRWSPSRLKSGRYGILEEVQRRIIPVLSIMPRWNLFIALLFKMPIR